MRKNTVKIGVIGTGSRGDMPPLQAADLLAYCVYTALIDPSSKDGFPILDQLDKCIPLHFMHADEERLIELVDKATAAEESDRQAGKDLYAFSKEMRKSGVSVTKVGNFVGLRGPKPRLQPAAQQLKNLLESEGERLAAHFEQMSRQSDSDQSNTKPKGARQKKSNG